MKYISLVNLIANKEVVRELVADSFTLENIENELEAILSGPKRDEMLKGYDEVWARLGKENAPRNAAKKMTSLLTGQI